MMTENDTSSERVTPLEAESALSERAEENIEAWEKKRATERGQTRREDLSDDAESGGP